MKSMLKSFRAVFLLLLGLSCLQQLTLAQSPGLTVSSPPANSTVSQGAVVTFFGLVTPVRYLTYVVTLAKTDGSSNTTIVTQSTPVPGHILSQWNVTANYPAGDYNLQIIAYASTSTATTKVAGALAATTTTVAVPVPTQSSSTLPSVYYWGTSIKVKAAGDSSAKSSSTSAAALAYGAGSVYSGALAMVYKMSMAMGVLALGCVLAL